MDLGRIKLKEDIRYGLGEWRQRQAGRPWSGLVWVEEAQTDRRWLVASSSGPDGYVAVVCHGMERAAG